jgi:hypothetical protein
MSNYTRTKTKFTNAQTLVRALCRTGFTEDQIEVYQTPQPLYGYQGEQRQQTAQVIIRRQHVGGAANDIGFYLDPQDPDNCRSYISEYDSQSNGYDAQWQRKLAQNYALEGQKSAWAKRGFELKEEKLEGGQIRLTMGRKVNRWK